MPCGIDNRDERTLSASLLQSARFAGRIRIDARGNAIFPREDKDGLYGFEIKKTGFPVFATGVVFPSERGTPLSKDNVWRRNILPKLEAAGLQFPSDVAEHTRRL